MFITILTLLAVLTRLLHWTSTKKENIEVTNRGEDEGYQGLPTTGKGSSRISIEQRLNHTSEVQTQLPTGKPISITPVSKGTYSPPADKYDSIKRPELSIKAPADSETLVKYDNIQQPVVPKPVRGYALAESYWEQQTTGSRNVKDLQCWAGQLNLSVVEPFMVKSFPRTPLSNDHMNMLHFSDLFDLQSWNKDCENMHHSQLVSWEDFMQHAPRDVILVVIRYAPAPANLKKTQQLVRMYPSNYPPASERYKTGCNKVGWQRTFLTSNHFKVVREVCFNFEYGDNLTTEAFSNHIYAEHMPSETTVIFKEWRSLGVLPDRIIVGDSTCFNTSLQERIHPSLRLSGEAKRYHEKYLNGGNYIAIIARLEKSRQFVRREGVVTYCLDQIVQYQHSLRAETGMNTTFLSIDIGKYGSSSYGGYKQLQPALGKFFRGLYNDSLSMAEWEKTFEDSQTTDPGYIAQLQKIIATQADCLIFSGGGSFQRHALRLYQELHPVEDSRCIRIITECTRAISIALSDPPI